MARLLRLFRRFLNGHAPLENTPKRKEPSEEHLAILEDIEKWRKARRHLDKQSFVQD